MSFQPFVTVSPQTVSELSSLFATLKDALTTILNLVKTNAELDKILAGSGNPELLALEASLDEILTSIEELKGGGLHGILAHPYAEKIEAKYDRFTKTMTLTPTSALLQTRDAFDDEGDTKRPNVVGNLGGLVIVATAPGLSEFADYLEALGKFFNRDDLLDLFKKLQKRIEAGNGEITEPQLSTGIDFFALETEDYFPEYIELLNTLQSKVEGIKSSLISAKDALDDIAEFVDKQIAELEDMVDSLIDFLDKFEISLSGSGVSYQYFELNSNTAESIKTGIMSGHPAAWQTCKYTAVIGTFASDGALSKMTELIGLS